MNTSAGFKQVGVAAILVLLFIGSALIAAVPAMDASQARDLPFSPAVNGTGGAASTTGSSSFNCFEATRRVRTVYPGLAQLGFPVVGGARAYCDGPDTTGNYTVTINQGGPGGSGAAIFQVTPGGSVVPTNRFAQVLATNGTPSSSGGQAITDQWWNQGS